MLRYLLLTLRTQIQIHAARLLQSVESRFKLHAIEKKRYVEHKANTNLKLNSSREATRYYAGNLSEAEERHGTLGVGSYLATHDTEVLTQLIGVLVYARESVAALGKAIILLLMRVVLSKHQGGFELRIPSRQTEDLEMCRAISRRQ